LPLNPWTLFLYLALVGSFLSYAPVPWGVKGWVAALGMGLPLAWAIISLWKAPSPVLPRYLTEGGEPMPGWPWVLLLLLAAGARLWHLTSLSSWPMPDDGMHFFYAAELGESWRWKFFFSNAEFPPMVLWLLALYSKVVQPSLMSLWLFPALISFLTFFAVQTAVRSCLPRPFAFWAAALFAFNFPSLYLARFCQWSVLVLAWTVLALALLAELLRCGGEPRRSRTALMLGVVTGLGFFAGAAWPAAALCLAAAVGLSPKARAGRPGALFFAPPGLLAVVYLALSLGHGTRHIRGLWVFSNSNGLLPLLGEWAAKAASLFWYPPSPASYGPLWGGLLNPLLGAMFFTDLLEGVRHRRHPLFRWAFLSLPVLLAPGFLAGGFEAFRWAQAYPLMLLFCTAGLGRLWVEGRTFFPRAGMAFLGLAVAFSASLDFYHLAGPYHRMWGEPNALWREFKSAELFEAYRALSKTEGSLGKGFLLYDLVADPTDQTLDVACFPFDASRNRSIAPGEVKWVAFLTDADEKPFLEKRFPEGRWYWLPKEAQTKPEPQMLGVVGFSPDRMDELGRWMEADRRLQPLTTAVMDNANGQSQEGILEALRNLRPLFQGDPFLETCFWEKTAFHQMAQKDDRTALRSIQEALRLGYPAAHVYNLEGVLLEHLGRSREARRAFQAALRCGVNFSPARENLEAVEKGDR
jgi:hypothetical protein